LDLTSRSKLAGLPARVALRTMGLLGTGYSFFMEGSGGLGAEAKKDGKTERKRMGRGAEAKKKRNGKGKKGKRKSDGTEDERKRKEMKRKGR